MIQKDIDKIKLYLDPPTELNGDQVNRLKTEAKLIVTKEISANLRKLRRLYSLERCIEHDFSSCDNLEKAVEIVSRL